MLTIFSDRPTSEPTYCTAQDEPAHFNIEFRQVLVSSYVNAPVKCEIQPIDRSMNPPKTEIYTLEINYFILTRSGTAS